MLGAGASIGGSSRGGAALPGGVDLAREIRSEFGLSLNEVHLGRAFKKARSRRASNGDSFEDYIAARFIGVTPPGWMRLMVRLPWQRIWTLNIDDAVERAYENWSAEAIVRARGASWSENSASLSTDGQFVHVVHLHGRASKAAREGELVFSTTDYANAYGERGFWHSHFAGEYESSPTLAIGVSLDNEFDLETILQRGKVSHDLPSFIVSPKISEEMAEEYRGFGLTPVRATADTFFEALHQSAISISGSSTTKWNHPMDGIGFKKTWTVLSHEPPSSGDERHDFYAGHEPTWSDAWQELPSHRDRVAHIVRRIEGQKQGSAGVHVLTGEAYSGKSSAILSAARQLHLKGFEPLLFSGEAAPTTQAMANYANSNPKVVFIFDGAEDFARDVGGLVATHKPNTTTLRLVLVDRSRALEHIKLNVPEHARSETLLRSQLSENEIVMLFRKLKGKHRLGHLSTGTEAIFVEHFNDKSRRLFDGMASLENGRGFVDRIGASYEKIRARSDGSLVRLAALASLFGYGIPTKSLTAASGLPAHEVDRLLSNSNAGDFVHIRGDQMHIRSRHFGEALWETFLTPSEKAQSATRLAIAISPYVNPKAISEDSLSYRLARSVMDEKFVRAMHSDRLSALRWYETLEKDYEWNARFWEQRALLASNVGKFEEALSWSTNAVSKLRDSYSLNTVGVVLMRRALFESSPSRWPMESFSDSEQYLRESRGMRASGTGRERPEYPFVTFFSGVSEIMKITGPISDLHRSQVQKMIVDWQLAAHDISESSFRNLDATMRQVVDMWQEP